MISSGCMIAKINNFEISLQGKHCGLPKLNFFPNSCSFCISHSMELYLYIYDALYEM